MESCCAVCWSLDSWSVESTIYGVQGCEAHVYGINVYGVYVYEDLTCGAQLLHLFLIVCFLFSVCLQCDPLTSVCV